MGPALKLSAEPEDPQEEPHVSGWKRWLQKDGSSRSGSLESRRGALGENQKDSPGPRADGCWAPEAGEGTWLAAEVSLVIEDTRTMDNFTQYGECGSYRRGRWKGGERTLPGASTLGDAKESQGRPEVRGAWGLRA